VGARINSMTSGRVIHVGWGGWGRAYGVHVIIDHGNGVRTAYCHMSRTSVGNGASVSAGQQIGNVGTTGNSTGPHCHVESRTSPFAYNNRITDPQQFFGAGAAPSQPGRPVVYISKLRYGQRDSDSVRHLQRTLNGVRLTGGTNLPVTGNFGEMTRDEVKKWQSQVAHDAADGALGPRQAALLFGAGFDVRP
jgi:hypothetical protein